jgi:hypothetical protein
MNKPLGQDSTKRKKSHFQSEHEDDIFVQNFLKRFSKGGDDDEDDAPVATAPVATPAAKPSSQKAEDILAMIRNRSKQ